MKPTPPAPAVIDELGAVKAKIAALIVEETKLKQQLVVYFKATGVKEFYGELFNATVSQFEQETLDMVAVRKKLSAQFIDAHTKKTPVIQVRVNAKKRG